MNCCEAQQGLLDSFVQPLSANQHRQVDEHISCCEICRSFSEIQRNLDDRLATAAPQLSLGPQFRKDLRNRLTPHTVVNWPDFLPDIAHFAGCALAIVLLVLCLPQHSRIVLQAGLASTIATYFVQASIRSSLEGSD